MKADGKLRSDQPKHDERESLRNLMQAFVVVAGVVLAVSSVAAPVYSAVQIFGWPPILTLASAADELALESAILTAATLALAIVAAIVAIAAYLVAIRRPKLVFFFAWDNVESLQTTIQLDGSQVLDGSFAVESLYRHPVVKIANASRNAARTPAVRLRFFGFRGTITADAAGVGKWTDVIHPDGGPALQWDGGGDVLVYGTWMLPLGSVDLSAAFLDPKHAEIGVELVADGFSKSNVIPVTCTKPVPPVVTQSRPVPSPGFTA